MMTAPPSRSPWMFHSVPDYPPLTRDAHADVCIVGAGIAGLTTAYLLGRKGRKVLVIDDGPIGGGMTSRTTAHLASALDDRFDHLEKLHGEEGAKLAGESHAAAIEAIEAIIGQERIDCDFLRLDGYLFLPPGGDPKDLEREYAAALRAGQAVEWAERAPMPGVHSGRCLRFAGQGQFHPLKYLAGLARAIERDGGVIHSGTHAAEAEEGCVRTSTGLTIDCQHLVVATNTPINDRFAIHTKQAPYLTYAIALRVPPGSIQDALMWDTLDPCHYVRLDRAGGELLIVGGEDHKTGQAEDGARRHASLERWARERFAMAGEVVHAWVGQVMEPVDGLAFIGVNPGDKHVYVATGDSGMGMTHGTIAGLVITDLIHGVEVPWARLYDPSRKTLRSTKERSRFGVDGQVLSGPATEPLNSAHDPGRSHALPERSGRHPPAGEARHDQQR